MKYEEFVEQMTELVRQTVCGKLAENTEVAAKRIVKNNNMVRIALCILEPENTISPTIYLEPYFERCQAGESLALLAEELVEEYQRNSSCRFLEAESLSRWETVREYTACKLIHTERNRELLEDLPHRSFLDCAIVYYLELSDPMIGEGTALIHNRHLDIWQITEEELYRQAYHNTEKKHGCRIQSLNQIMMEMVYGELGRLADADSAKEGLAEEETEAMERTAKRMQEELCCPGQDSVYLMTNREQYFGAVTLIYDSYLRRFADSYPEGFYVIPGSIHEVLLVPGGAGFSQEELESMLWELNQELEQDDPQSFLSENIYYYDRKEGLRTLSRKE